MGDAGYFYFHTYDGRLQVLFDNSMCDERTNEGQLIKKWQDLWRSADPSSAAAASASPAKPTVAISQVSPRAINAFLEHMANTIHTRYKLASEPKLQADKALVVLCIRLYVDRYSIALCSSHPLSSHLLTSPSHTQQKFDLSFSLFLARRCGVWCCGVCY